MGNKNYTVLIGNFGSGKTELAIHLATGCARAGEQTLLVDLDVINPYFRATDRRIMLREAGVKIISPTCAERGMDIPALPAEVLSAFALDYRHVFFDCGGDPTGSIALGQYKAYFDRIPKGDLDVLFVVNVRRPLAETPEQIMRLLDLIEDFSRLRVTGLINNSNLSVESSSEDLLSGYDALRVVSERLALPVRYTSGEEPALSEFLRLAKERGLNSRLIGEPLEISTCLHRDWERFTRFGT